MTTFKTIRKLVEFKYEGKGHSAVDQANKWLEQFSEKGHDKIIRITPLLSSQGDTCVIVVEYQETLSTDP